MKKSWIKFRNRKNNNVPKESRAKFSHGWTNKFYKVIRQYNKAHGIEAVKK